MNIYLVGVIAAGYAVITCGMQLKKNYVGILKFSHRRRQAQAHIHRWREHVNLEL